MRRQADPVARESAAVEERPLDRDQDQPGGGDQDGGFLSWPGFRSWGGLLVQGLDVGAQDAAGGTGVEVDFGGDLAGDPGRAVER